MFTHQFSEEPQFGLSEILGTLREAVLVIGPDMRVKAFNGPAEEAFPRKGEDILNRRLSEVFRDFTLHEAFDDALRGKSSTEVRFEIPGEERRVFDVLVSPLDLRNEAWAIGIFYEITHIEKLERVRQEFLSNISHELRTPLTSILAFVETLEDGAIEDTENSRKFLAIIRKNAKRMRLLVNDISELSSIETGSISVEPRRVECGQIAADVISSLSAAAADREVVLENEIPAETVITADPGRLQQMLTNLVDNAIKFNRRGGTVFIRHEVSDNGDILAVTDTGEGILREHQQQIFKRFYRIDTARSTDIGGTGLGLSIVKHLAIRHGGEVSVSSKIGEGTTFRLLFPVPKIHASG